MQKRPKSGRPSTKSLRRNMLTSEKDFPVVLVIKVYSRSPLWSTILTINREGSSRKRLTPFRTSSQILFLDWFWSINFRIGAALWVHFRTNSTKLVLPWENKRRVKSLSRMKSSIRSRRNNPSMLTMLVALLLEILRSKSLRLLSPICPRFYQKSLTPRSSY